MKIIGEKRHFNKGIHHFQAFQSFKIKQEILSPPSSHHFLLYKGQLQPSYLHLSLFLVAVVPQHHLAVFPTSGHHGTILQDTDGENAPFMRTWNHLADAVTAWQSREDSRHVGCFCICRVIIHEHWAKGFQVGHWEATFGPDIDVTTGVSCDGVSVFSKSHTQHILWFLMFLQRQIHSFNIHAFNS